MKKYLLLLFLCTSVYSQTISEKWNSLYNRYDYTDSSGNLVGYKGYNSLTESWEYTTVKPSNQNNDYQSPINLQLLDRALANKQAQYDKRVIQQQQYAQSKHNEGFQKVKTVVEYYRAKLRNLLDQSFSRRFEKEVVTEINNAQYDYSRMDADEVISWINDSYNRINGVGN